MQDCPFVPQRGWAFLPISADVILGLISYSESRWRVLMQSGTNCIFRKYEPVKYVDGSVQAAPRGGGRAGRSAMHHWKPERNQITTVVMHRVMAVGTWKRETGAKSKKLNLTRILSHMSGGVGAPNMEAPAETRWRREVIVSDPCSHFHHLTLKEEPFRWILGLG